MDQKQAALPLDRGRMSVTDFDRTARKYIQRFTRARVGSEMRSRVYDILNMEQGVRSRIRQNFSA